MLRFSQPQPQHSADFYRLQLLIIHKKIEFMEKLGFELKVAIRSYTKLPGVATTSTAPYFYVVEDLPWTWQKHLLKAPRYHFQHTSIWKLPRYPEQ